MMKMGPVKPMAVMSAKGIFGKAVNHKIRPRVCTPPRQNCPAMLTGMYVRQPSRNTQGRITSKPNT